MLTVYYIAATWLQSWRLSSALDKIRGIRRRNGSIVMHNELSPCIYMVGQVPQQKLEVESVVSQKSVNHAHSSIGDLLWYSGKKKIVSVFPKQIIDISGWISVIAGRTHIPLQIKGVNQTKNADPNSKLMVLFELDYNTCKFSHVNYVIEAEDFGMPVAWFARESLFLIVESDEAKFASLCVTFQNDVVLENGLEIIRIETVEAIGHPYKIQNSHTVPETYAPLDPDLGKDQLRECFMSRWRAHVSMLCTFCDAVQQVKETLQDISVRHPGSGVGAVKLVPSATSESNNISMSPVKSILQNSSIDVKFNQTQESSTPSSIFSMSRRSTETLNNPDSTRLADSLTTSVSSLRSIPTTPRRILNTSELSAQVKPPNIFVFSDSLSSAESVRSALEATLEKDRYTIHLLFCKDLPILERMIETALVVIHGNIPPEFTYIITEYFFVHSCSILCLCSDLLGSILPVFQTAEVRPNELVRCSYKSWKHVPLLHHVFCYQPSPPVSHFSNEDQNNLGVLPPSVDHVDKDGKAHRLKVEVLGAEETWQTPSLLLLSSTSSKIVFSQVHLEVEPSQYESDEKKRLALGKSDKARLEILCDVLNNHLGLCCSLERSTLPYTSAYFLGNHETKKKLIDRLREDGCLGNDNTLQINELQLKFCGKGENPLPASSSFLPVLMHSCPQSFSTVDYFENLKTEEIGRLVIFSEVMTSSMELVQGPALEHGFTVIPKYQTKGRGRGGNKWLSPLGCAMFTVQLHIPLHTYLGQHLPFLQNLCGLAVVLTICKLPGLEELDIGIKWPNDIYALRSVKIGGIVVNSILSNGIAVCNIGCGVNLNNSDPTLCLNDMIKFINKETKQKLPLLGPEKYFALLFNTLEDLFIKVQNGGIDEIFSLYYNYWLHTNAEIEVKNSSNTSINVIVKGIDEFGFLVVETSDGKEIAVQPDGNTFDMMTGCILPKVEQKI